MKHIIHSIFAKFLNSHSGRNTLEAVGRNLFCQPHFDSRNPPFSLSPVPKNYQIALIPSEQKDPIFVTSRFRTGSTFFWSLFDQTEEVTAYYEPLNERRWFLPSHRGEKIDATHSGVRSYWQAYEGMEDLASLFSDDWGNTCLYMDPASSDPALEAYIKALVSRASGVPLLQFNRVDFRLPWLKCYFPRAKILHLYRDPRDQWVSILGKDSGCTVRTRLDEFSTFDRFYLLVWAKDLARVFPFLALAGDETPYALHYLIWRLSHSCGVAYADLSFSYEDLIDDPATVNYLLKKSTGLSFDRERYDALCSPSERGRWQDFAEPHWYESVEAKCERLLDRIFSPSSPDGLQL